MNKMAKVEKNKPKTEERICFSVPIEQKQELIDRLQWGDLKQVYGAITDQLLELLREFDPAVVKAGIVSRKIKLENLIDYNKNKEIE